MLPGAQEGRVPQHTRWKVRAAGRSGGSANRPACAASPVDDPCPDTSVEFPHSQADQHTRLTWCPLQTYCTQSPHPDH